MIMPPLQFKFSHPLFAQGDLDSLSLPALLWGKRHGFWGFEHVVKYAECHYAHVQGDILVPLAALCKNEYADLGSKLLNDLMHACVHDTRAAHQQSADEVFARLFDCLARAQSPELLSDVFGRLCANLLFVHEDEWAGYPATPPYEHDCGPTKHVVDEIITLDPPRVKQ